MAPISPDWIRTTDIASIDADGFVTLHGRADGAINRGGFKILPETVRRVLISHPAVRDACVVGVPDKRLGQVPFAAIEATPGMPVPSEDELKDLVRQALPVYNVPVAFAVVDELPRNPALKVSLPEVAALYDAARKQVVARRVLAVVVQRRFTHPTTAASSPRRTAVRPHRGRCPARRTTRR